MTKYSTNEILEYANVMTQYEEMFGEDSGMMYVGEITNATRIYKECIEKGKSYEELYGKPSEEDNY